MHIVVESAIRSFVGSVVVLAMICVTYMIGPEIEYTFLPVAANTKVAVIPDTPRTDANHLLIVTSKVRNCKLQDSSGVVQVNGSWVRGTIFYKDPRTGDLISQRPVRPAGQSTADEMYIFPKGDRVKIELLHECHPFWQSRTALFDVSTKASSGSR